jgi:ubiquinone/menaquinone biosynthesis C-methylase UbiE
MIGHMPSQDSSVDAFTAFELRGWQSSADPYHRYFGALTSQVAEVLLDELAPDPTGRALLDVATGPGYLARRAAQRGFHPVVGVDFSKEMIALARRMSPPNTVEFREGDAQQLAEADASFDAVAMNFGLLHLSQPQKAVAESYRVLKPGGRFGFTVWSEPQKAVGFALMLAAIKEFADQTVPVPEGPPFFYFSSRDHSVAALQTAGFSHARFIEIPLIWKFNSGEELFQAFLEGTARTGGLLRLQTPKTLASIRQAVAKGAERFKVDGQVHAPMSAVLVVGTKA